MEESDIVVVGDAQIGCNFFDEIVLGAGVGAIDDSYCKKQIKELVSVGISCAVFDPPTNFSDVEI